jgi:hypothetical protein
MEIAGIDYEGILMDLSKDITSTSEMWPASPVAPFPFCETFYAFTTYRFPTHKLAVGWQQEWGRN